MNTYFQHQVATSYEVLEFIDFSSSHVTMFCFMTTVIRA